MTIQRFAVIQDEGDYLVADASFGPKSAALVPSSYCFRFVSRKAAEEQAKTLSALSRDGRDIPTRMIETPDRFEQVADALYGPAWE